MSIFPLFSVSPADGPLAEYLKKRKKAPGEKLPALTPFPDGVEFGQRHEPVNINSARAQIADFSSTNACNFHPHAKRKVSGHRNVRLQFRLFLPGIDG